MSENEDLEVSQDILRITEMIQEMGYKAKPIDDVSISTALSGFSSILFYFPGHSIQMYTGFKPLPGVFGINEANAFNEEYRFVRCYVKDSGIRFEGDFFFDLNEEDAGSALRLIFKSWEITHSSISEAFTAAESAARQEGDTTDADAAEEIEAEQVHDS